MQKTSLNDEEDTSNAAVTRSATNVRNEEPNDEETKEVHRVILNKKYILERTLGKGTSCKVKLGREIATGKSFALKIFFKEEFTELAETEIEALAHLSHPNIVGIHDYGSGELVHSRHGT